MPRAKVARSTRGPGSDRPLEWPAVVYFWAFGLAVVAYTVARFALDGKPHPYHWLAALAGGVLGIPLGWLWFHWRGDVF